MTRKLGIVTSTLFVGATLLGPATGIADDRSTRVEGAVASNAEPRVPLPVSRPAWIERAAAVTPRGAEPVPRLLADTSTDSAGAASGGSGMKSGSSEALAVQLEGAKVLSSEGTVVGQVEKVVEEQGAGRQAVVSVGGFLGIGESRVLVPAETLAPSGKGMVRTELTEQQIKDLPAYEM